MVFVHVGISGTKIVSIFVQISRLGVFLFIGIFTVDRVTIFNLFCACQGHSGEPHSNHSGSMTAGDPSTTTSSSVFKYPYSELMLWAILLRRQQMAKFMWQMGDEALAKVRTELLLLPGLFIWSRHTPLV